MKDNIKLVIVNDYFVVGPQGPCYLSSNFKVKFRHVPALPVLSIKAEKSAPTIFCYFISKAVIFVVLHLKLLMDFWGGERTQPGAPQICVCAVLLYVIIYLTQIKYYVAKITRKINNFESV